MSRSCIVIGGGGHAASVIDAMLSGRQCMPVFVLDEDSSKWGREICGIPVYGGDEKLTEVKDQITGGFVVGVGAATYAPVRRRLFEYGKAHDLKAETIIHARATVSPLARIGAGTVVLAAAVVGPRATVGDNVIVNTGAIVEHDCTIADHSHIASGAVIAGDVGVGEEAFVGAGALIKNGIRVGARAVVGAGAVVVSDVDVDTVVVGNPAKRQVSSDPKLG